MTGTNSTRALQARSHEWISPQTVVVRDVDAPQYQAGREMGEAVLRALGFDTGFTHMEWFRTPSGEAVFGEIAARPPGAHLVDLINYASDVDVFTGWAEAVCHNRFSQHVTSSRLAWRSVGHGRAAVNGLRRPGGRPVTAAAALSACGSCAGPSRAGGPRSGPRPKAGRPSRRYRGRGRSA